MTCLKNVIETTPLAPKVIPWGQVAVLLAVDSRRTESRLRLPGVDRQASCSCGDCQSTGRRKIFWRLARPIGDLD
eukprot:scaffold43448_cov51-Cyclotella_meneghiniana.AAC.16